MLQPGRWLRRFDDGLGTRFLRVEPSCDLDRWRNVGGLRNIQKGIASCELISCDICFLQSGAARLPSYFIEPFWVTMSWNIFPISPAYPNTLYPAVEPRCSNEAIHLSPCDGWSKTTASHRRNSHHSNLMCRRCLTTMEQGAHRPPSSTRLTDRNQHQSWRSSPNSSPLEGRRLS